VRQGNRGEDGEEHNKTDTTGEKMRTRRASRLAPIGTPQVAISLTVRATVEFISKKSLRGY
jgi:hypothetical protein